jgi:hypothetical protein
MDDDIERKAMQTPDNMAMQRYVAAHHEAAHTVARVVLGESFYEVTVDGGGGGASRGYPLGEEERAKSPATMACVSMAGPAVEAYFWSMKSERPWTNEELFEQWWDAQQSHESDPDVDEISDAAQAGFRAGEGYTFALALLEVHWDAIKALATELLEHGRVGHDDVDRILPGFGPLNDLIADKMQAHGTGFFFEWIRWANARQGAQ